MITSQYIRELEKKIFPEVTFGDRHIELPEDSWTTWSPHIYFETPQLVDEEMVEALRAGKKMLSVGCGHAFLERLMIEGMAVPKENILLADVSDKCIPDGYGYAKFDMLQQWPISKKVDYIIFPNSIFAYGGKRAVMYTVLRNALPLLEKKGQLRIKGIVGEELNKDKLMNFLLEHFKVHESDIQEEYLALKL